MDDEQNPNDEELRDALEAAAVLDDDAVARVEVATQVADAAEAAEEQAVADGDSAAAEPVCGDGGMSDIQDEAYSEACEEIERLKAQHEEMLLKHAREQNIGLVTLEAALKEIERLKAEVDQLSKGGV